VVASALAGAAAASLRQAWQLVSWNVHDCKMSQAEDEREGSDYDMRSMPAADFQSA